MRRTNPGYRRNTIAGRWRPWLRENLADTDVTPLPIAEPAAFDDSPTLWDQPDTLGSAPSGDIAPEPN